MSNWSIDYASLSPSNGIKLANPVGFEPSAFQKYTKHEKSQSHINQTERDEQQIAIKIKRAWDVAMAPAKSIPMNAVMIYMSGSSLQIFTVMVTVMLFLTPIKAIMSVQQTFSRFETTEAKPGADLWMPKLTFIGLHFATILLGIYKVNVMGLLPTTVSDWLAFIPPKQVLEFTA